MKNRLFLFFLALLLITAAAAAGEDLTMNTAQTEYRIPSRLGTLYGVLQLPAGEGPVPLIILSHGFGGNHLNNMDYAAYFTAHGFAAFSLDFCGGGPDSRSGGTMTQMSVLTEADDLSAVVDRFTGDPRFSRVFLWGASQGGFVSSCVAARRPDDISAMVLEYPAYVLQDDARERAGAGGVFPDTSDVMGLTIGRVYNEDAVSFDVYDLLGSYPGDVLILHGDRDAIVPLSYAERAARAFPAAELIVMPGQGHVFFGPSRREAMERELAFFEAHTP